MAKRNNSRVFGRQQRGNYIREILIIILLIAAIVIVGFFLYFNLFGPSSRVKFVDSPTAEVGTEVYASSFITDYADGVVNNDVLVDTSRVGPSRTELVVEIKGIENNYAFDVEIVDTTPPVIGASDQVNILLATHFDPVSEAQVTDNSGEELAINVEGTVDTMHAGAYPITLSATDSSGNTAKRDVTINVLDMEAVDNVTFITEKGYVGEKKDGVTTIDGVLMVNKTFSLPDYYGDDMWDLAEETYVAFWQILAAAEEEGYDLYIFRGFRSYYEQLSVYESYVWNDGYDAAEDHAARAGYSEHQSGLAIDLNEADAAFGDTDVGKWVNDNCWRYGFIIRFPLGKEEITGYRYEPWHLRYVGRKLAEQLYNGGNWLSMEEYYGVPSFYSHSNKSDYVFE